MRIEVTFKVLSISPKEVVVSVESEGVMNKSVRILRENDSLTADLDITTSVYPVSNQTVQGRIPNG
jgi:hypothetical protein